MKMNQNNPFQIFPLVSITSCSGTYHLHSTLTEIYPVSFRLNSISTILSFTRPYSLIFILATCQIVANFFLFF
ncbi:MAG: hypothetical protein C5B52_13420 [Bacteroidetes bacterium]|nr:MAG: hypothetical protein C5B52_13420 [Bacteroidota bacterium]